MMSPDEPLQSLGIALGRAGEDEDAPESTAPSSGAEGDFIPLSRPMIGNAEWNAVRQTLQSGWVSQGPTVAQFENAVAEHVGARHAVAVSSATAALHLAMHALGIGPGDEVVVPSLTFIATANAVVQCGAEPVFADVDEATFNLDPRSVDEVITKRTKAILVVHQLGLPADLGGLQRVADRAGCMLLEDAACALGATYKGIPIGRNSRLACFSFHARKVITTGEGGMIVTTDGALAERLRRLRHHGMDRSDWQRHNSVLTTRESYLEVGFNYRMSDIAAAVGLAQMNRLEEFVAVRRGLARVYDDAFGRSPHLRVVRPLYGALPNAQSYAVCLQDTAAADCDRVVQSLRRKGIGARHGLACIHKQPCYAQRHGRTRLPRSELLAERMFLLPLFPGMTPQRQGRVIDAVLAAMERPPDVGATVETSYLPAEFTGNGVMGVRP